MNRKVLAAVLTIVFGAIPATCVAVLPLFATVVGVAGVFVSDDLGGFATAAALAALGSAGLFGTVSLWWIGLFGPRRWTVAGLAYGLLAIAPFTFVALRDEGIDDFLHVQTKGTVYLSHY